MIKGIVTLKFRLDLSKEAARAHWMKQHAVLAMKIPGLRRYVQSHRAVGAEDMGNAPYDGFESFWFDDETAAQRARSSSQMALAMDDADAFADRSAMKRLWAQEIVKRDVASTPETIKLVTFNCRKAGLSPQQFRHYWSEVHGPLVMKHFAVLRRYVQNHGLDSCYAEGSEPPFDGWLEAWLESVEALRASEGTADHTLVRNDEANFLDGSRGSYMMVRDHVVL